MKLQRNFWKTHTWTIDSNFWTIHPEALTCQLLQVIIHIFSVYHLIPRIALFQKLLGNVLSADIVGDLLEQAAI